MNVRHLRYALAAADHGSFRRAGRALGIDSSVLSRRVRDLEVRLGSRLFERSPIGLTLTDAGKRFVPQARNTLHQIAAIFDGESMRKGRLVARYRIQMRIERCLIDDPSTASPVEVDISLTSMLSFLVGEDCGMRIVKALQEDELEVTARIGRAIAAIADMNAAEWDSGSPPEPIAQSG